jgi:hypothetical protein
MDSGTSTKVRKVISNKEFKKILRENETFLLHLTAHIENLPRQLIPINLIENRKELAGIDVDPFEIWLTYVDLNYFEIEMKNAVDIMLDFGYDTNYIIKTDYVDEIPITHFHPAMLIVHQGKVFYNSQSDCYCIESITEGLLRLNPNLVIITD